MVGGEQRVEMPPSGDREDEREKRGLILGQTGGRM